MEIWNASVCGGGGGDSPVVVGAGAAGGGAGGEREGQRRRAGVGGARDGRPRPGPVRPETRAWEEEDAAAAESDEVEESFDAGAAYP